MTDVGRLATALLGLVQTGFADHSVALPKVAYVAPGSLAAYDTEQITVNLVRLYPGRPGGEIAYQEMGIDATSAEFLIAIVRNSPTPDDAGNAPSQAKLVAAGLTSITDAITLRNVLIKIRDARLLVTVGVPTFVGAVSTEGPTGGVQAVTGRFQVQLL